MAALGGLIALVVLLAIVVAFAVPIAIIWLIVTVLRNVGGRPPSAGRDPAVEELRYRLARGEITDAQFEQGMWDLGYEKVRA
jgi:uncharacterized membrane protein